MSGALAAGRSAGGATARAGRPVLLLVVALGGCPREQRRDGPARHGQHDPRSGIVSYGARAPSPSARRALAPTVRERAWRRRPGADEEHVTVIWSRGGCAVGPLAGRRELRA